MKRIFWCDELRGIGIVLVVMGHMIHGIMNAGIVEVSELLQILDRIIYSFHMPLMFILSGYLSGYLYKNPARTLKTGIQNILKNIMSLYIPYLFFIYLYWGIGYFIFSGNDIVDMHMAGQLFYNPQKWHYWFFLVLCIIKIMQEIVLLLFPEKYAHYVMGIIVILLYVVGGNTDIELVTTQKLMQFGIYFWIGYEIGKYKISNIQIMNNKILTGVLFIFSIISLNNAGGGKRAITLC